MAKLSKNIIYNFLGQTLLVLLGFVAVRYIFRDLGPDALGIIYFIAMMNAVFSAVLEMGICATTVREVSGHYASDPLYIKRLIKTFSLFYWSIYFVLSVVLFFAAPIIARDWLNIVSMEYSTAVFVLRFLGISALTVFPKSFFLSLFRGLQKMEINNIVDVAISTFQQFGAIAILTLGGRIYPVVLWYSACYILQLAVYILLSAKFFSFESLLPGYSHDVIKRNRKFATRMMAISALATLNTQADKLVVSKILPINLFGYYGFTRSSLSRVGVISGAVSQAAYPLFSELHRKRDNKELMFQYRKLQDALCFGIVPVFAVIMFFFLPVFSYIFDPVVARKMFLPVFFLCVGFYMNGTLKIPHIYSLAVGNPGISAKMNLYALLMVLPVTILLVNKFDLVGAGLSWIFYNIASYCYAVPRVCKECLGIPVLRWYEHIMKICLLSVVTYGLAGYCSLLQANRSIQMLSLSYVVASIVFFAGAFYLMDRGLRESLMRYLPRAKTFVKTM